MPNWEQSMQQTFEYYIVDPATWTDKSLIKTIKTSLISRDKTAETLGSASFDIMESLGECYVRVYLITVQEGIRERYPLGTFLIQTPSTTHDGKIRKVSVDAYTPLLELKENPTPLGYSVLKGDNIMSAVYRSTREHVRAPVVPTECTTDLHYDFVANTSDTWLTFNRDLMANAKYEYDLDELGRILFAPKQELDSLQPIWTYRDDNSSILYPDITVKHDLYGIPNVVEVVYSNGGEYIYECVVNDDPNSPTSTVNRGREIIHRETNPSISGNPTKEYIQEYARQLLRELSSIEYEITYTHGYNPVRLGDCVRLDSVKAGLRDVKAKVVSQSIKCEPGCPVTEKAVYTKKLWE